MDWWIDGLMDGWGGAREVEDRGWKMAGIDADPEPRTLNFEP